MKKKKNNNNNKIAQNDKNLKEQTKTNKKRKIGNHRWTITVADIIY